MKGFIDRIEENRIAVVTLKNGGEITVPADLFPFKVREGMHLNIQFSPDPEREEKTRKKEEMSSMMRLLALFWFTKWDAEPG